MSAHQPPSAPQPDVPVQIWLQPIAPPLLIGLYGFAGAGIMVGLFLSGVYGTIRTPFYLIPFVTLFGGVAQFVAGLWGFRARDALATVVFGLWGTLWISYGFLYLLIAFGVLVAPTGSFPDLGVWFIVVAWITVITVFAAFAFSLTMAAVLTAATLAAFLIGLGFIAGNLLVQQTGGWFLILSALLGWYTASAMLLRMVFGTELWPILNTRRYLNAPDVSSGIGEPGVRRG